MNLIKKLAPFLLTGCLLFCLTACERNVENSSLYFPQNTNNETMSGTISSEQIMETVAELYERSANIVVASVTEYEAYSVGSLPFVLSKAIVNETLKGDLKIGDEIAIEEVGEHLNGGNDLSIDGVPLLYPGMKVILFLGSESELENQNGSAYGTMGSYVGKFIYHPDGKIYNFSLIGGTPELTLSDVTGPLTEEEFRSLLPQESTTINTEITQPTAENILVDTTGQNTEVK